MTKRKSIIGLLFLVAVFTSAIAASSASAYTAHACEKVVGTGTTYPTATCETPGTGEFQTKPFTVNVSTSIKATATESFTLKATIGGIVTTIVCTGVEGVGATLKNEESGGSMFVSGTGKSKFTGCSLTTPAGKGCKVPTTLETNELTSKSDASGNLEYKPVVAPKFITITISGCEGAAAPLNGAKDVTGTAKSSRLTSATQAFTTTSGSALEFAGQPATFTGKNHFTTASGAMIGLETP